MRKTLIAVAVAGGLAAFPSTGSRSAGGSGGDKDTEPPATLRG
jgi:hypothetical protein